MGIETLIAGMPGTVAQGIIYGIMALGIFITFKLLNFADLSVDGSFATGGAVAVVRQGKSGDRAGGNGNTACCGKGGPFLCEGAFQR